MRVAPVSPLTIPLTVPLTSERSAGPLDELERLESDAVTIIREVTATCERPRLLFSGGKDSAVLLHVAAKAFAPGRIPFPVLHVDTGHNFPAVIAFRDGAVGRYEVELEVASVQAAIDDGRAVEERGPRASRNRLQTVALLDHLLAGRIDVAFGGARRDEEKARAKERILSFRDAFGQWDPKAQRPEPWDMLNARIHTGEHLRCFPSVQLDRSRHLALRATRSDRPARAVLRPSTPGVRTRRHAHGRRRSPRTPPRRRTRSRPWCATAP